MFDLSTWGLETALRAALLLVLGVWSAWWALGLVVAVFDRRTAARIGPPLLRAALTGGLVVASVAPAQAGAGTPVGALDGLPLPDRPLSATTAEPRAEPPAPSAAAATHVVAAGDCLWSIVRDRSPGAPDDQIAASVTQWHDTNRELIGPDPDLIQPGQRLVPPGAE